MTRTENGRVGRERGERGGRRERGEVNEKGEGKLGRERREGASPFSSLRSHSPLFLPWGEWEGEERNSKKRGV